MGRAPFDAMGVAGWVDGAVLGGCLGLWKGSGDNGESEQSVIRDFEGDLKTSIAEREDEETGLVRVIFAGRPQKYKGRYVNR